MTCLFNALRPMTRHEHIVEEVYNYKTRNTGMKTLRNYHGGQTKTDYNYL